MIKMPKIGQYKDIFREVKHRATFVGLDDAGEAIYNPHAILPTLHFKGTVKLHGTNAAIVYNWNPLSHDYVTHTQSRNNIITPQNDNAGFSTFAYTAVNDGIPLFDILISKIIKASPTMEYTPQTISIFGEWCGGNIQDKVALNKLPKMFVIFSIKIDDVWMSVDKLQTISCEEVKVYNILDFPSFDMYIDFNKAEVFSNKLGELTLEVEKECPVSKKLGAEGIGEGIVWKCVTEGYTESRFWFKVKGDEHAKGSGKVKTLAPVDIERFENIKKLVDDLVTERRLEQGFEYFQEMNIPVERKNIPVYIKWVIGDVVAEELNTIVENGFEVKDVSSEISKKARDAFFAKENSLLGL